MTVHCCWCSLFLISWIMLFFPLTIKFEHFFCQVANAQTLNINLTRHVLVRAKAEILHLVNIPFFNDSKVHVWWKRFFDSFLVLIIIIKIFVRQVELLIESNRAELADLLVDVVDIVLHCVDHNHLKTKSMSELFSPICLFPQISHCTQTRRIAVGTRSGIFSVSGCPFMMMLLTRI